MENNKHNLLKMYNIDRYIEAQLRNDIPNLLGRYCYFRDKNSNVFFKEKVIFIPYEKNDIISNIKSCPISKYNFPISNIYSPWYNKKTNEDNDILRKGKILKRKNGNSKIKYKIINLEKDNNSKYLILTLLSFSRNNTTNVFSSQTFKGIEDIMNKYLILDEHDNINNKIEKIINNLKKIESSNDYQVKVNYGKYSLMGNFYDGYLITINKSSNYNIFYFNTKYKKILNKSDNILSNIPEVLKDKNKDIDDICDIFYDSTIKWLIVKFIVNGFVNTKRINVYHSKGKFNYCYDGTFDTEDYIYYNNLSLISKSILD